MKLWHWILLLVAGWAVYSFSKNKHKAAWLDFWLPSKDWKAQERLTMPPE